MPPQSHSKVPVFNPFQASELDAIQGTFGFVSPRRSLTTCMVAHGVADSPTWVQVANPYDTPLIVRGGTHICYFHPREEWETTEAFIDPTGDEGHKEEKEQDEGNWPI